MRVAYMFSGQGAQFAGMGKELYFAYDECKKIFDLADEALGWQVSKLCFEGGENLDKTEFTQPAILAVSIAMAELLKDKPKPEYLLGLSLGEYSALVQSGSFDFAEALQLVQKRGRFMTEVCQEGSGAMSAVLNLSRESVEEVCREVSAVGPVYPANYNAPGQIVIAGEVAAVAAAEELAKAKGAKRCIRLQVSGAFHTPMLKPAADKLEAELKKVRISPMQTPVITNLTAYPIENNEQIIPTLLKQLTSPVLWEDSILYCLEQGVDTFIELGPGKTLCSFVKKINRTARAYTIEDILGGEIF